MLYYEVLFYITFCTPWCKKSTPFLADRRPILLHSMIGYWHNLVVCPSVCDTVHYGSQGRCTGLKVVPACYYQACSYLSVQAFLL